MPPKKLVQNNRSIRTRTEEVVNAFENDLLKQQLNRVYVDDVNSAYGSPLICFLYDQHCPKVLCRSKHNTHKKPGWQGAYRMHAKRKINYIHIFFKCRSDFWKKKLKCKKKLLTFWEKQKNDYYKILVEIKNNTNATWDIFNRVIGKKTGSVNFLNYFTKVNRDTVYKI